MEEPSAQQMLRVLTIESDERFGEFLGLFRRISYIIGGRGILRFCFVTNFG